METDHDNNIAILSKTVFKKASNRHHSSPNIQKTCALIFCGVGEQNLPLGQTLKYCKACHLVTYCCRDHQKQDWKNHKLRCASASELEPNTQQQLLDDWLEIHFATLSVAISYATHFPVQYDLSKYFWRVYTTYHSDQGANPATSFRIYKTEMITQKNSDPYNDTVKGFFETEVITPENAKSRLVMQIMVKKPGKHIFLTQFMVFKVGSWILPPSSEDIRQWQERFFYTVNSGIIFRVLDPTVGRYDQGFIEAQSNTSWEWKALTPSYIMSKGINKEKLFRMRPSMRQPCP